MWVYIALILMSVVPCVAAELIVRDGDTIRRDGVTFRLDGVEARST